MAEGETIPCAQCLEMGDARVMQFVGYETEMDGYGKARITGEVFMCMRDHEYTRKRVKPTADKVEVTILTQADMPSLSWDQHFNQLDQHMNNTMTDRTLVDAIMERDMRNLYDTISDSGAELRGMAVCWQAMGEEWKLYFTYGGVSYLYGPQETAWIIQHSGAAVLTPHYQVLRAMDEYRRGHYSYEVGPVYIPASGQPIQSNKKGRTYR